MARSVETEHKDSAVEIADTEIVGTPLNDSDNCCLGLRHRMDWYSILGKD